MNIITKTEIFDYLLFEKESRRIRDMYQGSIKPKTPNVSEDASESLGCHLLKDGFILKQLYPITSIERQGKKGKDILVNNYHKLEIKGTSSSSGCITTSESNYEAFAWVWFDFRPFFDSDLYVIPVHVIKNPRVVITSTRHVETLNENKLSLPSVIKDAVNTGNYERLDFNLKTMIPVEDISMRFF